MAEGLNARVFPGEHLMLSVVEIAPGSVSPVHSHPNEQWGVCLEGERAGPRHSFMWGSSQSRRALPMRLIMSVVTKIARPGKVAIHHELSM